MSVLYKDGNGNISTVAGSLQQSVVNEIKKFIYDFNVLDWASVYTKNNPYNDWSYTCPSRGIVFAVNIRGVGTTPSMFINEKYVFASVGQDGNTQSTGSYPVVKGDVVRCRQWTSHQYTNFYFVPYKITEDMI